LSDTRIGIDGKRLGSRRDARHSRRPPDESVDEPPGNQALLREALSAGVNFIDTAHLYTGGDSERTIGAALATFPEDCVVATKGGYRPGEGRPEILSAQIEESLRRLRADQIELYYLHRVDLETPLETSLAVIGEYRDRGKIRHVGISEVSS
jgi:pyridoxine 4-dehydrogenase